MMAPIAASDISKPAPSRPAPLRLVAQRAIQLKTARQNDLGRLHMVPVEPIFLAAGGGATGQRRGQRNDAESSRRAVRRRAGFALDGPKTHRRRHATRFDGILKLVVAPAGAGKFAARLDGRRSGTVAAVK
jgi:hypothetical protein